MRKQTLERRYLDVHRLANYLGLSEQSIRYSVEIKKLPFHRFGKRILFDKEEIDALFAKNLVKPIDSTARRTR